jgi:hypothetical protein
MRENATLQRLQTILAHDGTTFYSLPYALFLVDRALRTIEDIEE